MIKEERIGGITLDTISSPVVLGTLTARNRIVRSSTAECMCTPRGEITNRLLHLYDRLSQGGAGTIITGGASIHPSGYSYPRVIGADSDWFLPGLRRLASTTSRHGSLSILQIYHCGRQRSPGLGEAVAPSPITDRLTGVTPRALSTEEIEELIAAFGAGARRCREAGFDGVQLAACNGHLVGQFLSPYTNRRRDQWGGSPERRRRFLIEVVRAMRISSGPDYPIMLKLGMKDFVRGGLTEGEAIEALAACSQFRPAAVEVTGGIYESFFNMSRGSVPVPSILGLPEVSSRPWPQRLAVKILLGRIARRVRFQEAFFRTFGRLARASLQIPVILVGGIRSRQMIDELLSAGDADLVALSRPLILEPDLPQRLLSDAGARANCTSCNECLVAMARGEPLHCHNRTQLAVREASGVHPSAEGP